MCEVYFKGNKLPAITFERVSKSCLAKSFNSDSINLFQNKGKQSKSNVNSRSSKKRTGQQYKHFFRDRYSMRFK